MERIPCKLKTNNQGPCVDFWEPCPVHPKASHVCGDCFNNSKNKTSESQYNNNCNQGSLYGHSYNYSTRGHRNRYGCGHGVCNHPQKTNLFPSLHIKQAPGTNFPDALSTVTYTDNYTVAPHQSYVIKPITNKRNEKNCVGQQVDSN